MTLSLTRASLTVLAMLATSKPGLAEDPFVEDAYFPDSEPANITIQGDTMVFEGDTSEESWAALSELVDNGATQNVTRMIITSPGGDTFAGRKIARWVHDNIAVLEVDGMCFSSCANYIFPAALRKIIREDAFVAWHGSERSGEIVSLNYPGVTARVFEREELREAILYDQPDLYGTKDLTRILDHEYARFEDSRADESRFFEEIGVDDKITYFGLLPGQYQTYLASRLDGWTFSLADMKRFGIDNVSYAGDGRYVDNWNVREQVNILILPHKIEPDVPR